MIEKSLYVLGIFSLVLCLSVCSGFAAIIKLQGKNVKLTLSPGDVIVTPSGQKFIYQHYIKSTNGIRYIIVPGETSSTATSDSVITLDGYKLQIQSINHDGTINIYAEAVSTSSSSTTSSGASLSSFENMMFNPLGFLGTVAPAIPFDLLDMLLNYYGFTKSSSSGSTSSKSSSSGSSKEKGTSSSSSSKKKETSKGSSTSTTEVKHITVKIYNNQAIIFNGGCGIIKVLKVYNDTMASLEVIKYGKTTFEGNVSIGETFTLCDGNVTIVPTEMNPKLTPKEVLSTGFSSYVIFKAIVSNNTTWKIVTEKGSSSSSTKSSTEATSDIIKPGQYKCFSSTECIKVFKTSTGYVVSLNNGTGVGPAFIVNDTYPEVEYIRLISSTGFPKGKFEVFIAQLTSDGVKLHRYVLHLATHNFIINVPNPKTIIAENGDMISACDGNISIPIGGALHALVSGPYVGVYNPSNEKFYQAEQRNRTNLWPIGDLSINGNSGYLYPVEEGQTVTVVNKTTGQKLVLEIKGIDYVPNPSEGTLKLLVNLYAKPEC